MVHGHVFEIKEADYQTTCCFKTRVARGRFGRTKADLGGGGGGGDAGFSTANSISAADKITG